MSAFVDLLTRPESPWATLPAPTCRADDRRYKQTAAARQRWRSYCPKVPEYEVAELTGMELPPLLSGDVPAPSGQMYYDPAGRPIDQAGWIATRGSATFHSVGRLACFYRAGNRIDVSTVWLGIDHSFGLTPVFWETAIFVNRTPRGPGYVAGMWRYASMRAAHAGHVAITGAIRAEQRRRRSSR